MQFLLLFSWGHEFYELPYLLSLFLIGMKQVIPSYKLGPFGGLGDAEQKNFCRRFQTLTVSITVNGHVDGKLHDNTPFLKLKTKFVIQD